MLQWRWTRTARLTPTFEPVVATSFKPTTPREGDPQCDLAMSTGHLSWCLGTFSPCRCRLSCQTQKRCPSARHCSHNPCVAVNDLLLAERHKVVCDQLWRKTSKDHTVPDPSRESAHRASFSPQKRPWVHHHICACHPPLQPDAEARLWVVAMRPLAVATPADDRRFASCSCRRARRRHGSETVSFWWD